MSMQEKLCVFFENQSAYKYKFELVSTQKGNMMQIQKQPFCSLFVYI
jgi:hypothetical protein